MQCPKCNNKLTWNDGAYCAACMSKGPKRTKRDRINHYASQIGELVPRLYSGSGGQGSEIHELKVLVDLLAIELA